MMRSGGGECIPLGLACGQKKERVGEAGSEAAEVYVWATSAVALLPNCRLGPLGNGGHWECLSD